MIRWLVILVAGIAGTAACARILGLKASGRGVFEHRAHLLEGLSCVKCHPGVETAGESGPVHLPTTADCMACHKKPHDTRECSGCHGQAFARFGAEQARRYLKFTHSQHLPRVSGNCVRCHPEVARDGSFLRPSMASCFACHEHADQFRVRDCKGCHVSLPTEGTRPTSHVIHDDDFMSDHGTRGAASTDLCETCHKQSFCAGCHGRTVPVLPERVHFDLATRPGVHRAGFRSRHAEEARSQPGLCTICHSENSCQSCHEARGVAATVGDSLSPHGLGWIGARGQLNEHGRAAWRNPLGCASCHGGAGEALCVGCHRVGANGGSPHPPGWTSRRSKTELPCLSCHGGAR